MVRKWRRAFGHYTNNGNVGIGTTSPGSYKLNVAGTAYATDFKHSCPSGMTSINGKFCIDTTMGSNRNYWESQNYCADNSKRLCTFEEFWEADRAGYPTDRSWSSFTALIIPCSNVGGGCSAVNDGALGCACVNAQVYHYGNPDYMHWDGNGDAEARPTVCCY